MEINWALVAQILVLQIILMVSALVSCWITGISSSLRRWAIGERMACYWDNDWVICDIDCCRFVEFQTV